MTIQQQLALINNSIRASEKKCHRAENSVTLLAVSKKQSVDKIRDAYLAGQHCFGENYVQEALEKQQQLRDLAIEWHFIGSIQSNKTKLIATHFDWVHSVDRLSIAEKLNQHRASLNHPLNICIEVNIDSSPTKSGMMPTDVIALAEKITTLKNLTLRGLMVIPEKENASIAFAQTRKLFDALRQKEFQVDTLSMGMSNDFETAIIHGSTMVRIGTAIFGERD